MNILTKSQAALLRALDGYELKQASLSDLRRDTGLTVRGIRQIAFALEERAMLAMEGNKCSLTFAGQQALVQYMPASSSVERAWREAGYPRAYGDWHPGDEI